MRRVRLTTDRVGGFGWMQRAGDEIDMQVDEALSLVQAGQAEFIETAMKSPVENTAKNFKRINRR